MSDVITVDLLDSRAAMREALDESSAPTRAEFFRRAIVGGGAFAAGGLLIGGLPTVALGQRSAGQDREILNFASCSSTSSRSSTSRRSSEGT